MTRRRLAPGDHVLSMRISKRGRVRFYLDGKRCWR